MLFMGPGLVQIIICTSLVSLQRTKTLGEVKSCDHFYVVIGENNLTIGPVKTHRHAGINGIYSSI